MCVLWAWCVLDCFFCVCLMFFDGCLVLHKFVVVFECGWPLHTLVLKPLSAHDFPLPALKWKCIQSVRLLHGLFAHAMALLKKILLVHLQTIFLRETDMAVGLVLACFAGFTSLILAQLWCNHSSSVGIISVTQAPISLVCLVRFGSVLKTSIFHAQPGAHKINTKTNCNATACSCHLAFISFALLDAPAC